jgi:hypothetical protein
MVSRWRGETNKMDKKLRESNEFGINGSGVTAPNPNHQAIGVSNDGCI